MYKPILLDLSDSSGGDMLAVLLIFVLAVICLFSSLSFVVRFIKVLITRKKK